MTDSKCRIVYLARLTLADVYRLMAFPVLSTEGGDGWDLRRGEPMPDLPSRMFVRFCGGGRLDGTTREYVNGD